MLIIQRPEIEADEPEANTQRFTISPLEPGFAAQQAEQRRDHRKQRGVRRQQRHGRGLDQITAPSLKIGRYIAMTRPPTSTPRIAMMSGSSSDERPSTAVSTSSS